MVIAGEWLRCADGQTRPIVLAQVLGAGGQPTDVRFLIDSGADATVFSAAVLEELHLSELPPPPGLALRGISGDSSFVVIETVIELKRNDGGPARIRGSFAAFTDSAATDLSVLGRDVLDNFDVILSRPRNEVLALAGNHRYAIQAV